MSNNISTFYQGQLITIVMRTQDSDTTEQKAIVAENTVYFGIYGENSSDKLILSTLEGGGLTRTILEAGNVTVTGTLLPTTTKSMQGNYTCEMLIKSEDNTKAYPSENIIRFNVEKRKLAAQIG